MMTTKPVKAVPTTDASVGTVETIEELHALLAPVMKAIATAVCPHCEVMLHDLSSRHVDLRHTIRAIENPQVTRRSVGGPSTNLGSLEPSEFVGAGLHRRRRGRRPRFHRPVPGARCWVMTDYAVFDPGN